MVGWVHQKEGGGYCVWDGSTASSEDAEPIVEPALAMAEDTPEPVPEAVEEVFEEVAAESTN